MNQHRYKAPSKSITTTCHLLTSLLIEERSRRRKDETGRPARRMRARDSDALGRSSGRFERGRSLRRCAQNLRREETVETIVPLPLFASSDQLHYRRNEQGTRQERPQSKPPSTHQIQCYYSLDYHLIFVRFKIG